MFLVPLRLLLLPELWPILGESCTSVWFAFGRRLKAQRYLFIRVWILLSELAFVNTAVVFPRTFSLYANQWTHFLLRSDESLWQTLDLAGRSLQPGVIGHLLPLGVTAFRCPRSCIGNPLFKTNRYILSGSIKAVRSSGQAVKPRFFNSGSTRLRNTHVNQCSIMSIWNCLS